MNSQKTPVNQNLQSKLLSVAVAHFFYACAYLLVVIAYSLWQLVTPDVVLGRTILGTVMLGVSGIIWLLARKQASSEGYYKMVRVLIALDVIAASFNIYTQRGMASRAVALFAIPIVLSALLPAKNALLKTAGLCATAYFASAAAYFKLYFNEGYQVELYGEVGFYGAMFFVLAALLITVKAAK